MVNQQLRSARMEKGLSRQALADAVGVTRRTIDEMAAGTYNATIALCNAICAELDKSLDELFGQRTGGTGFHHS